VLLLPLEFKLNVIYFAGKIAELVDNTYNMRQFIPEEGRRTFRVCLVRPGENTARNRPLPE
jgi:hypothetical protein